MNIKTIASFFIAAIGIVTALIFGRPLLIPLVFALLLWFIIIEIKYLLNKIPLIKSKAPAWLKSAVSFIIILGAIAGISMIVSSSIENLSESAKNYESNFNKLVQDLNHQLGLNIESLIKSQTGEMKFGEEIRSALLSVTNIVSSTLMVFLYCAFIFVEQTFFNDKIRHIFGDQKEFEQVNSILQRIERSVARYLSIKTLTSVLTGILSFFVLWIIGVDSPEFWAFLIFLLNYIPSIGSFIGTFFPALFSIVQFGDFTPGLLILLFVGLIQLVVGNVLEPKLMGNSMNLSPLVVILALSFWAALWGPTGAILSVPITVIMVIVFSQFPSTRAVAILLSEKGEVE